MEINSKRWDEPVMFDLSHAAVGVLMRLCAYADRFDPETLLPYRLLESVGGISSDEFKELLEADFVCEQENGHALNVSGLNAAGITFDPPAVRERR